MSDRVKPWDTEDLRKILAEDSNVEIDALPKDDWIGEFSKDELESVLEKATFDLWLQVAKSSHISTSWLEAQSNNSSSEIQRAIAGNPRTPPAVLERFARMPVTQIAVAGNPSTPVGTLIKLSCLPPLPQKWVNEYYQCPIAEALISNPNCPSSVLHKYVTEFDFRGHPKDKNCWSQQYKYNDYHGFISTAAKERLYGPTGKKPKDAAFNNPNAPPNLSKPVSREDVLGFLWVASVIVGIIAAIVLPRCGIQ